MREYTFSWLAMGVVVLATTLSGCGEKQTEEPITQEVEQRLFSKIEASESGVTFRNKITDTRELNYMSYDNLYTGAGVAAGDLNNDGLVDLYFTGNQVTDKVYLNKGDFKFEDITAKAISTGNEHWHRGVVITDVNADGWNDIYVCRSGWQRNPEHRKNLLYINNKDLTFSERAEEFGLADTSHSTQAAFFDFDLDGDLDMYLLNHPAERTLGQEGLSLSQVADLVASGEQESDRLYRNDDGRFVDISKDAGINNFAFGLGIGVFDLNHDGWPDIYVANDFAEPDFLYMNNGNGGFSNEVKDRTPHVSNFGMGVDVGDINNDLEPEVIVMDMAYKSMVRSKKNMGSMAPEKFWSYINYGYHYQYMINTLQLNLGNGHMSEIAQLAGVPKSDWSWAGILSDLDNDGYKDLYISNGIKRDVRNNDAQNKIEQIFRTTKGKADLTKVMATMPENLVSNSVYQNNGDLTFSNQEKNWGLYEKSTTQGLVLADLDNDGDLDIVGNREDAAAGIYRNESSKIGNHHFLQVTLQGNRLNPKGIGSKIIVTQGEKQQLYLVAQSRGYQSGFTAMAHFGFGEDVQPVNVEVTFPDGRVTTQEGVTVDQRINLEWSENLPKHTKREKQTGMMLTEAPVNGLKSFKHTERIVDDFKIETLLPHKYSQLGPFISTADVNADGLEDMFVSGSSGMSSRLFIGRPGGFKESKGQPFSNYSEAEDLGSVFFDSDGDGDQDLLVIPGGNEHLIKSSLLSPRLYLNNGSGKFSLAEDKLPEIVTCGMKAAVGDYDGDGDLDVFIGGRNTPAHYPFSPRSFLLNNNNGVFTDVTQQTSPDLMGPGMVTDVEFSDMDEDGDLDLVMVGEWMPISIFNNENGTFQNTNTFSNLSHSNGWWYSLEIGDFNNDGKKDIAAGNLGKNTKYHASLEEPLHVYWSDFDQNGVFDIVLAMHQDNSVYPVRGRECTSGQMPFVKQKYPTFEGFAEATLEQVYEQQNLDNALHLVAYELQSSVFINSGSGNFEKITMPSRCQMAPINDIIAKDMNGDKILDLIVAGNNYDTEVETVRYDGGTGLVLIGDGTGNFKSMPVSESGFYANGNCKDLELIDMGGASTILVANNKGKIQGFVLESPTP